MKIKNRVTSYFAVAILIVMLQGCKKEPLPIVPTPVTKIDMLTYSSWQLTAQGFDTNFDGTIDIDETPPFPCVLDNLVFFYKSNSGSFDQGPTKCDPNHDQYRKFDWEFISTDSIIVDGQAYKVLTLTAEKFDLSYEDVFTTSPNSYILQMRH